MELRKNKRRKFNNDKHENKIVEYYIAIYNMLLQLYYYFENLLTQTLKHMRQIELRNMGVFKSGILIIMMAVYSYGVLYCLKSFSSQSKILVDFFFEHKIYGFDNIVWLITRSFGEMKLTLCFLIIILLFFNLTYHQYINRVDDVFFDIIDMPIVNADENNIDTNLNKNDTQNVHNSTISKYAKKAIKKLIDGEKRDAGVKQSYDEVYNEIYQYLINSSHPSNLIALEVIDQIYVLNAFHIATNLNEIEILRLVWQRIKNPVNIHVIDDLKESLLLQLADCQSNGVIVCITGRVARILQTLECIDADLIVNLKPMWAIKENIAEYFSRYTDKLINKVPSRYRDAFVNINRNHEDEKLMEKFNDCLIKNLNNKFKLVYLDTNILTQKQLDELSAQYFQNVANI